MNLGGTVMRNYIHDRKFIRNFLTRLVAAEILFVIFLESIMSGERVCSIACCGYLR